MKNKSFKDIALPAIMLFIIAAVCTGLLAGTNLLTKDRIAQLAVTAANEAKAAVLEADSFSDVKTLSVDGSENIYYEAYDESGSVIGYVFDVTVKSYGGDLSCMVGISAEEEKVTGVEITSISDTPGLGMKATGEDFLGQFIDKADGIGVNKNAPSDNEIQAITGATISSQAVTNAVNEAFSIFNAVKAGVKNG